MRTSPASEHPTAIATTWLSFGLGVVLPVGVAVGFCGVVGFMIGPPHKSTVIHKTEIISQCVISPYIINTLSTRTGDKSE